MSIIFWIYVVLVVVLRPYLSHFENALEAAEFSLLAISFSFSLLDYVLPDHAMDQLATVDIQGCAFFFPLPQGVLSWLSVFSI